MKTANSRLRRIVTAAALLCLLLLSGSVYLLLKEVEEALALWRDMATAPEPARCALCGDDGTGSVWTYPCLVELGSGRAGEIRVYDVGGESLAEIEQFQKSGSYTTMQFVLGQLAETCTDGEKSVTSVRAPGGAARIDPGLYCLECRKNIGAVISACEIGETGYVLADLYDPEAIRFYPLTDGGACEIRGYTVTAAKSKDGWTVTVTGYAT